jgi:hypothetical protein
MDKTISVKLTTKNDLKEFLASVTKLSGSVRALQGDINVDAKSALGIASMMVNGMFDLKFIDCQSSEAGMFEKWRA